MGKSKARPPGRRRRTPCCNNRRRSWIILHPLSRQSSPAPQRSAAMCVLRRT